MTELLINGVSIPIEGTEIALTFSSFSLDNPGIRKGSYSNLFEIAKSNEVRRALESAEEVTSLTNIPYQINTAVIKVDGMEAVRGTAILEEVGDTYRVFISAGNSDFFKYIGSLKLVDLDLASYDHEYNPANVVDRRETEEGFVYPNIDYGFFEHADPYPDFDPKPVAGSRPPPPKGVPPYSFFQPSFWAKTLINRACELAGYTLKGAVLSSLLFKRLVVLCRGAVADLVDYLAQYRHEIDYSQLTGAEVENISFPERVTDKSGLYSFDTDLNQFVYRPANPDGIDTRFEINLTGKVITNYPREYTNATVWVELLIYGPLGDVLLTLTNSVKFSDRFFGWFNRYIRPKEGVLWRDLNFTYPGTWDEMSSFFSLLEGTEDLTELRFAWRVRSNRGDAGLKFLKFEGLEFIINQVLRGGGRRAGSGPITPIIVRPQNVLPKGPTVGDLLILVANLEGLIIQVDEVTKEVNTARLDDIQSRKGEALDWSTKLDLSEPPKISYRLPNFARSNFFEFAGDDKDAYLRPGAGRGVLTVQDANLPSERPLFVSKFAPVPMVPTFQRTRVMGRVFTGDKYDFDGFSFNLKEELAIEDFAARVAVLSEAEASLQLIEDGNLINYEVNEGALDFSRALSNNYSVIKSALDKTKIVKALFLLDRTDLDKIDYKRPVYVEHFGEYFFVQQITQYKLNRRESCEVTLIRI